MKLIQSAFCLFQADFRIGRIEDQTAVLEIAEQIRRINQEVDVDLFREYQHPHDQ